jgi:hypothetical protein
MNRSGLLLVRVTVQNVGTDAVRESFDTLVEVVNGPTLVIGSDNEHRGPLAEHGGTRQIGFLFESVPWVVGQGVTVRASVDPPIAGSPGGKFWESREDNNESSVVCNFR